MKPVFPPIPAGQGRIRIGSGAGLAREIQDDAQGHIWHLLQLLDGTRTTDQLLTQMREFDPVLERHDIEAALGVMESSGFLEDADAPGPIDRFSDSERERYHRNLEFFGYFADSSTTSADFQLRLKQARVTVLGLGGLGTNVALSLAAVGVGSIDLVDHDVVELANLNRQILYTEGDIGRPKAAVAAERLKQMNPNVDVAGFQEKMESPADCQRHMTDSHLLICAADRPRILLQRWLNHASLATGTPWLRGANDGLMVNLQLHVPHQTACLTCIEIRQRDRLEFQTMQDYIIKEMEERTVNPCTSPVAGMVGHLAALETVKHLTGIADAVSRGSRLSVDLLRMTTTITPVERDPACPDCSPAAS
ncbi:TOMM precursor leader peptide-binding protein [Streptomyces sp. NPDC048297]|uniref:TOMM precursor leader peptide-binding protein n=1 Tax=Streptomyces sp. NPDC048297 TaxID=3365531 RepID=UPI003724AD66